MEWYLRWTALALIVSCWGCNSQKYSSFEISYPSYSVVSIDSLSPLTTETVYLHGQVIKQIPLLNRHAYELADDTGVVVVLSENQKPALGEILTIRAQVRYESIPIQGQELGALYVVEMEQISVK